MLLILTFIPLLLTLLSLVTRLIVLFWIGFLVGWGYLLGSGMFIVSINANMSLGLGMVVLPRVTVEQDVHCCLEFCPGVGI